MRDLQAIQRLVSENSEYTSKLTEANIYAKKWHETGLLEGLEGNARTSTAILLENQARQLMREANVSTNGTEAGGEWSGVALPLVRRIMDNMNAKDLVSVQPMSLPSGLVFYLDFTDNNGNSLYGDTSGAVATGGMYNNSFNYSDGSSTTDINYDVTVDATLPTGMTSAAVTSIIDFDGDDSYTIADYTKITVTTSSSLTDLQLAMLQDIKLSFIDDGAAAVEMNIVPKFTKFNGTNQLTFIVLEAGTISAGGFDAILAALTAADDDSFKLTYPSLTIETRNGSFEATSDTSINIPEINMQLSQSSIIAKIRKLKAIFTPEIQQDLQAYQAIDANVELTRMLADKISAEIDLEILTMLMNGADATNVAYWSAKPGYIWNGTAFTPDSNYHITSKSDWYRSIGVAVRKISNMIYKKTLMGGVNFMVCSPEVATIFESMPGFNGATRSIKSMSFGVQEIGLLNNEIAVYKNPYWSTNKVLCGHKGEGSFDTGAVYAPYIPLLTTPLIYDAENFTPRKGVASRYATKMLRNCFYGIINIGDLDTV